MKYRQVLANASKVMNRMIELKGLTDVLKNSSDNDNYNRELRNLQVQLYEMSHLTFNGEACLRIIMRAERKQYSTMAQDLQLDNTMSLYVSSDGSGGPKVSINKALLLAALTMQADDLGQTNNDGTINAPATNTTNGANADNYWSIKQPNKDPTGYKPVNYICVYNLCRRYGFDEISVGVFTQALRT